MYSGRVSRLAFYWVYEGHEWVMVLNLVGSRNSAIG